MPLRDEVTADGQRMNDQERGLNSAGGPPAAAATGRSSEIEETADVVTFVGQRIDDRAGQLAAGQYVDVRMLMSMKRAAALLQQLANLRRRMAKPPS